MVPFTITRDVVCVNGGHGGSIDWLLEVSTVNNVPTDDNTVIDVETFKVTMEDRSLAKFMGLDCSKRKPFEGTTLIAHMGKLRNAAVDRYILEANVCDDPMGDVSVDSSSKVRGNRSKAFDDAQVPEMITIEVCGFTRDDGARVPTKRLRVVSTPRRDVHLQIELSESTLGWMGHAIMHTWDVDGAPWVKNTVPNALDNLPELPEGVTYKKRGSYCTSIVGYYRNTDGLWKAVTKSIGNVSHLNAEALQLYVAALAGVVQQGVNDKHVEEDAVDAAVQIDPHGETSAVAGDHQESSGANSLASACDEKHAAQSQVHINDVAGDAELAQDGHPGQTNKPAGLAGYFKRKRL